MWVWFVFCAPTTSRVGCVFYWNSLPTLHTWVCVSGLEEPFFRHHILSGGSLRELNDCTKRRDKLSMAWGLCERAICAFFLLALSLSHMSSLKGKWIKRSLITARVRIIAAAAAAAVVVVVVAVSKFFCTHTHLHLHPPAHLPCAFSHMTWTTTTTTTADLLSLTLVCLVCLRKREIVEAFIHLLTYAFRACERKRRE